MTFRVGAQIVGLLHLEEATQKVRDFRSPRLVVVKEAL
jgi:hypothetical protein